MRHGAKMVHYGLFVGNDSDVPGFSGSVLHCARDPWFPKNLPDSKLVWRASEYEMMLKMVDAADAKYFSDEMVNPGLDFITERFAAGDVVLVHCNQGLSRSPSVAFLWLHEHGFLDKEFRYAVPQFKEIYKDYNPNPGIFQYLKNRIERP